MLCLCCIFSSAPRRAEPKCACADQPSSDPYAMHFGMIRASDLVLVNEEGRPMIPTPHKVNRAGFMIHCALHQARPDINAACHTHSPHGRAWSTFGKPIEMITQGIDSTTLIHPFSNLSVISLLRATSQTSMLLLRPQPHSSSTEENAH